MAVGLAELQCIGERLQVNSIMIGGANAQNTKNHFH